ncbi:EAL and HDOD domain-containing protein [Cellulomonas citrea]|uniref:EAL and HDOD domain-containing protein n=1 Tax=Cellulomonas citrea TaxID=1909423 RepID=UPI00135A3E5E|nr:HDOD domain-containing protein [Cellulomonas citrea]
MVDSRTVERARRAPTVGTTVAVALQRIEDTVGRAVGHELLFRPTTAADGSGLGAAGFDDDAATASVLSVVTSYLDVAELAGDGLLFVNLPRSFVVGSLPLTLPPGRVVLEVLERVEPDDQVRAALVHLRAAGYLVALDDMAPDDPRLVLADLADVVKVDLADAPGDRLVDLVAQIRAVAPGARLVAERIETPADRAQAVAAGFTLLQGYLLSRPAVVGRGALAQHAPTAARLLALVMDAGTSTGELVEQIASDPGITVKVLRAVNNASGARRVVVDLSQALALLGRERLRQLLVLDLVAGFGHRDDELPVRAVAWTHAAQMLCPDRPQEAAAEALVRLCADLLAADPARIADWLGLARPEPAVAAACDALDAYVDAADRGERPTDLAPFDPLEVSLAWFTGLAEGRALLARLVPRG